MTYALIQDGAVAQYPYSAANLRRDNPGVSFPRRITDDLMAAYGAQPVTVEARPDVADGEIAEKQPPALVDGVWTVQWTVRSKTADEIAADRAAMRVSRPQFAIASHAAGLITEQEAEDWAAGAAIPAIAQSALTTLPERIEARTANYIRRNAPLITKLQTTLTLTDAQVDALFEETTT